MKIISKLWNAVKIPLLAILAGLIAGGVIIAVTGSNPFKAYYSLLQGSGLAPKSSYAAYKSMLTDFCSYANYFTPMIFAALAVAVALRAGLFNIGVSGQMLAAGFTASIIVGYSGLGAVAAKPLVIIIGIIVGGVAGAVVGFLKYKFNINEVVSTIMFNYIFQYVISFFINTYFVDPVSRQSKTVSAASRLTLMDTQIGSLKIDIPLGIILALITVYAVWFILEKTKLGYELKAVGFSKTAAKYAGINVGKCVVISMTISGALGGLAGVTYYLGYLGSIQPKVLVDTGYDAIAVSLLGNNNPFGIIFSTMLITLIGKGSTYMKSTAGVDAEIASVITGVILLFSACNAYIKWKAANIKARKSLPANNENNEKNTEIEKVKVKAGKEEK
jgi:simple sugar transport system permease protein